MKPILFKFRIAALSLLISGLLVVSFGVFFLVTIGRVGITRIDNEIRALGEGQVRVSLSMEHWTDFGQSLHFIYGDQPTQRFAVRVFDKAGDVLFTSEQWPAELSTIKLPELGSPPDDRGRAPRVVELPAMLGVGERPNPDDPTEHGLGFIQRLDRDGDHRGSAREFDWPPDHFDDLDLDHDGYVDTSKVLARLPDPPHSMGDARGGGPGQGGGPGPFGPDSHEPRRPAQSPPRTQRPKVPVFETHDTSTGAWRVGFMGNDAFTLVIAADLAVFHREAILFRNAFLVVTPLALLILGMAGWVLASRALRPVTIISRTAEAITARDLNRRVPSMSADIELQQLVNVINRMLERLEQSFHQAARFSADAAHELQTPLTVLQGELDNAVQVAEAGSKEQQRYSDLLEEVRGLKTIVRKLLLLARADVGQLALSMENVDLSALLETAVDDIETMAPHLTVEATIPPAVHVKADADLLGQVVNNMTSNAIKYSSANGIVRLALVVREASVLFTLANTSDPIPEKDRDKLFNRFHRVDKARSRETRGSGLGLSLAREIARAHGGGLVLDPPREGIVSFTLALPRG